MTEGEFTFSQASPEQVALAAELSYRTYKDTPIGRAFLSPDMVLRRWRWILDGDPTPSPFGLPAWVATRGRDVVGHFGLIPATALVDGRQVDVAWGRDFFVDASVRGQGVGSRLVETAVRAAGIVLVAGLNPPATRAYKRVGFVECGPIPFYVNVIRPAAFAPRVASDKLPLWAARAASEAAALWGRRRSGRTRRVRTADAFDDRFDAWWSRVERERGCVIRRTSATMNWRYRQNPSHTYVVLELERAGLLRGVAVVRSGVSRGLPAGLLVELLVEPGDREGAEELIAAARNHLEDASPVFLRCHTSGRESRAALVRAGFLPPPSPFTWMIANGQRLGPGGVPRHLFLNGGDSDLDFI